MESSEKSEFDYDGSSVIVHNSENSHILSEKYLFTDKIETIIYNVVATIGVKDIILKGVGKVSWYWTGYEGQLHT